MGKDSRNISRLAIKFRGGPDATNTEPLRLSEIDSRAGCLLLLNSGHIVMRVTDHARALPAYVVLMDLYATKDDPVYPEVFCETDVPDHVLATAVLDGFFQLVAPDAEAPHYDPKMN